ncbi:MAG: HEAT repeat domain-containing protein [Planctomycetes bacterium]|nr:HEAT repeat domain-containing protein [Planctomycetota bacterium]
MRSLLFLLFCGSAALADANLPAELKPLPKDSLSEQLDAGVRSAMDAARKKYVTRNEVDREAAVALLAVILHPLADDDLERIAADDGWPLVRLRAAEALAKRENRKAPMLAAQLSVCGVPPAIRAQAADLVARSGNAEAEEFLVLVLKHGSLRSLKQKGLGFDRSYNDLADLLYRTMGATALGRLGTAGAVKELIAALREPPWELRAAAARALGEAGSAEGVPALVRAAKDADMDVAIEAALALGRLGGAEAEAALVAAAKDKRALVARMAARALQHLRDRAAAPAPVAPKPPGPGAGGGTEAVPDRPPTRALPPPRIASPEGSLDLLFVLDATFSMAYEWPQVRSQVQSEIHRRPRDGDVRVGFVLFRDFDNQWVTKQHFLTWDLDKVEAWWLDQSPTGANAFAGSASDKALTVAAMLNLRSDYRPWLHVMSDAPPNDLAMARHRSRLLHVFESAVVDGIYIDRDVETRGFMTEIAEAGGGRARAFRSGGAPHPK